jgi:hypothetical protein
MNEMLFLVCREDAIDRTIKTSELFPVIVDYPSDTPHDIIVQETLDKKWKGYAPRNKSYYCVPMIGATLVTFKPKQEYDIIVTPV